MALVPLSKGLRELSDPSFEQVRHGEHSMALSQDVG